MTNRLACAWQTSTVPQRGGGAGPLGHAVLQHTRRTPQTVGEGLTLDTAFIDGPALTVARSRQRYVRQGARNVRYVDLGLSSGFEADLLVDADGLVLSYEHLFQRVSSPP